MKRMEEAKRVYDDIPVPAELSERVQKAIGQSDKKRLENRKVMQLHSRKRMMKKSMGAAAAMVVIFTAVLNTNTAFAESVSGLPVIGRVAKVLLFRSYEKENGDLKISVKIPSIEMISKDMGGLEDSINQEIHSLCESYADEALKRAEEYRQAFLDTGGTQEEWAAHNIEIRVSYEVKAQTEDYLSLAVMGNENWTSAYSETKYYNIDLKDGKLVTLKDILGENYVALVNERIPVLMKEREMESGIKFWMPEEGGFTGIDENTGFYINEAGNPMIVFEKYEIAPGAAGQIEFEIERH